jgi:uncharacterized Zn-binding protein involved in type VI secretion
VVPDISTGSNTRGLLTYLYGPGRRDEHTDPHLVAAWDETAACDPARDPDATITQLARRLDLHVDLRTRELGNVPARHVWHCSIRTAPGDRPLTDAEWAQVARRVLHATGIAPDGDDSACRWIAVRHADDHIHLLATTVRADGRRPRRHGDARRAQAECRRIEADLGLRRLNPGDRTAARRPTSAERAKADRRTRAETPRAWLRTQVRAAVAASSTEAEFFTALTDLGVTVKRRTGPSGDVLGYSVSRPGDATAEGSPVYFGGSTLAPDLSLPRIRERLTSAGRTSLRPDSRHPWDTVAEHLDTLPSALRHSTEAAAQAHLAALAETLDALASSRDELAAAARAFERAARSRTRADHAVARTLRLATRRALHTLDPTDEAAVLAALLSAAVLAVTAAAAWHRARGSAQQYAAARTALTHLQTAYDHAAAQPLADLTRHTPDPTAERHLRDQLGLALPTESARILADPAWPALAVALAAAEVEGHRPADLLAEAAGQRELATARNPAEVLIWRIQRATRRPSGRTQAVLGRTSLLQGPSERRVLPPTMPTEYDTEKTSSRQR